MLSTPSHSLVELTNLAFFPNMEREKEESNKLSALKLFAVANTREVACLFESFLFLFQDSQRLVERATGAAGVEW